MPSSPRISLSALGAQTVIKWARAQPSMTRPHRRRRPVARPAASPPKAVFSGLENNSRPLPGMIGGSLCVVSFSFVSTCTVSIAFQRVRKAARVKLNSSHLSSYRRVLGKVTHYRRRQPEVANHVSRSFARASTGARSPKQPGNVIGPVSTRSQNNK